MSKIHYAALIGGEVVAVEKDAGAAAEAVLEIDPTLEVSVQELDEEPTSNPPSSREMPHNAWDASGLPQIDESALQMRLSEAHARLLPYFSNLYKRGVVTKQYDSPLKMADAWTGQNYKTSKPSQDSGRPAQVMGLTLVPAAHARLAAVGEGPYARLFDPGDKDTPAHARELKVEQKRMLARWHDELPAGIGKKFTFCAGSSQDCRDSCLVFAGQNASERYNTYRKVQQTMALLNEPDAFARMLVESIDRWLWSPQIRSGRMRPFFRMNVLSDVPWEMVMPWMFEYFSKHSVGPHPLTFYDYTKVPGRRTPRNYDLTFSLSGTDTNRAWAMEEINDRGRRVAVVFIGHKRAGDRWVPVKVKGPRALVEIPLPRTFLGLPVIDGDISDVRPYDPAPSCVGLRWKTPSGKRAGATIDLGASAFVTPVYIVSADETSRYASQVGAGRGLSRWRGGEEPNPSSEQWLICANTPRYQPIEHHLTQPL